MMGYISKYDRTFISFVNNKYIKYKVNFKNFDDYIIWLYYKYCMSNTGFYYMMLEKDMWAYSDWQTGSAREQEKNQNGNKWKDMEKDKYGLYQNDKYVEFLKRNEWFNGKS